MNERHNRIVPDEPEKWAAAKHRRWIAEIRESGVAAIHPDDGWVHHKKMKLALYNPDYCVDRPLENGDRIVIGNPDHYMVAKIEKHKRSIFGILWWRFQILEEFGETPKSGGPWTWLGGMKVN